MALNQYVVQVASGDGALVTTGAGLLTGANAVLTVNNSTINDAGGTNVMDLSSSTGSVNTVHLTGTGISYLINVGTNEVITTVPTHVVVINEVSTGSIGTTVAMGSDAAPVITAIAANTYATYQALSTYAQTQVAGTVISEVIGANQYYADANGVVVELVGSHTANVVGTLLHINS